MILLTGGSGFLGQALAGAFNDQAITTARSFATAAEHNKYQLDLLNQQQVETLAAALKDQKISHLIHAAAVTPWASNPDFSQDLVMAQSALSLAESLHIPYLVFISGWVVYDNQSLAPYSEADTPCNPSTPYGLSKLSVENYLKEHAKSTTVINLRLASVFGPGQTTPGLIPNLVKSVLRGEDIELNSKITKRDYLYIDDLVRVVKQLTSIDFAEHTDLNIGSGQSVSVQAVAETIQTEGAVITGRHVELTFASPLSEASPIDNQVSIEKAQSIGLSAPTTPFNVGIGQYMKWVHDENNL